MKKFVFFFFLSFFFVIAPFAIQQAHAAGVSYNPPEAATRWVTSNSVTVTSYLTTPIPNLDHVRYRVSPSGISGFGNSVTITTEGISTVTFTYYRAINAGIYPYESVTATVRIDRSAPVLTITGASDGSVIRANYVTLTAQATDNLSGLNISSYIYLVKPLNGGPDSGWTFGKTITVTQPGVYEVFFCVVDNAGNVATKKVTFSLVSP